ncbi:MAG: HEAT repeat domain-containing protein [Ruminococcus sp.]|nr:HEAT repeat domain-containing protein [Ruminococcus sp.]
MTDNEINNIVNIIDSIQDVENLNDMHFETIRKYVSHENAFIRSRCAYMLSEFRTEKAQYLLYDLCSDDNFFVRTEAYDSLVFFSDSHTENILRNAVMNETDSLAGGYAVTSWCDVVHQLHGKHDDDVKFLLEIFATGKYQLECLYGLYLFGDRQALNGMLDFLKSSDYTIRCSVINLISDIMKEEDKDIIKSAVEELMKTEQTKAVRSDIEKIMTLFDSM